MIWILQNINKKGLILLGLLGVSVTTVSATLLYEFYKKNNDKDFGSRKYKSRCEIISIKFKVPNSTVAAVIGKGGRMIREIEMKTGVTINVQKDRKFTDRICVIRGAAQSVKLAQIIVQNIIDSAPVIDTYEFYVPYNAVKHILGQGRQNLQKIQEASNAKVVIDDSDLNYKSACHPANYSYGDPSKDGKKRIIVHGTVEQIEVALGLIEQKIQQKDGDDAVLQDLCPIKVPGAYTKLLTDELRKGSVFSKIVLSPLPPDDSIEVYVSAVETPSQFWIQIIGPGITYLESLVNEMSMYYDDVNNHSMHILKDITVGQVVAARCIYFDQWYRAEVTNILERSQYEVFLLDYGVFIECSKENLLELRTDMLSVRLQAVECKLANIQPKNSKWNMDACKEFASSTWLGHSKIIDAIVKGYIQRPVDHKRPLRSDAVVLCVELFDRHQNINIGEHLVSLGLAKFDEDVHSETTDYMKSIMKRQFLSVGFQSKIAYLTEHAKEDEMNEDKSAFTSNNSTSHSKKSNEPVKVDLTTSVKEHNDIIWKNEAETSTLDANKDDVKAESKPDNITTTVKVHIVSERNNEVDISKLDADKHDVKSELSFKPEDITLLVKRPDIVPKRKNKVDISTLDINKNNAKFEPDNVTTSVEEHNDVSELKNKAKISTLNVNKNDAKPESRLEYLPVDNQVESDDSD